MGNQKKRKKTITHEKITSFEHSSRKNIKFDQVKIAKWEHASYR